MKKLNFELKITLTYFLFGVCWIILTDILLVYIVKDIDRHLQFQSFKGIIFVVLSTLIIFLLSKRYSKQQSFIRKHLQDSRLKAEESEKLKSAFLANMSHEIRTPMNGILGFVKLLDEQGIAKEQHSLYISYIKKSSNRLLDTINDIIEISRIESNQAKLQPSVFELNETINYLFGFFKPETQEKRIKFSLKNSFSESPVMLNTDKIKLESILVNFLKNAIKFTRQGEIEFGCTREDDLFVFYVKDTGIGIPENRLEAIFERFTQAGSTYSKPYEGSGLGLSISKAYATLLNGKIRVESKVNKGSTFWFSFKPELAANL